MTTVLIILGVLFGLFIWLTILVTVCALYLSAQTNHHLQKLKGRDKGGV